MVDYLELLIRLEALPALATGWSLALLMHCDVLVQVGFLGERLVTLGLGTQEGTLTGMHAEMVKEVVPLAEEHLASRVVTFEELDMPLGPWIFILEDSELASGRNLLFYFDAVEIKVCSALYRNSGAERNLVSNHCLLDLVSRHYDRIRDHFRVRLVHHSLGRLRLT
jgi:hypothetical protein